MDNELTNGELNFSQALDLMKAGRRLTRSGWNGKDQWVVRQNGYPEGIPINRNTAVATGMSEGTIAKFEPYYMMFTAWGTFVPWVPSTGDLNAGDWGVYQTAEEVAAAAALAEEEAAVIDEASRGEVALLGAVPTTATTEAFVRIVSRFQDSLTTTLADLVLMKKERDDARAALAATEMGSLMAGGSEFERLAIMLVPTLAEWREQLGPEINGDGWSFVINGRRDTTGTFHTDVVTSMEMNLRDLAALEAEARLLGIVDKAADPERTQELVRPGDPGYPTRPQRLTDVMRLRQSFPGDPESVPDVGVCPQTPRYLLTVGEGPEREVSRGEWVSAERSAGFRPKGEDVGQPATAGFSGTLGGFLSAGGEKISGRVEPLGPPQQP